MNMFALIKRSAQGMKNIGSLVGTAMFVALNCVLGFAKIVLVPNTLEIQFSTLAHAACAYTYGPVMAGFAGILTDTIKYFLNPSGPYMPLYICDVFLFGMCDIKCFFYKKKITWPRVILARLIVVVLLNLTLTPLWLHMMYGKAFIVYVQMRIVKNILMFPFDVFLLYSVLKAAERAIPKQVLNRA